MTKTPASRTASTIKNQVAIDDNFYKTISKTVNYVLRKNAGSWITSEEIESIASDAQVHIWMKSSLYDSTKSASFETWITTLAHNYAISEAKKLKNAADRVVGIGSLIGFDSCGDTDLDPERKARSRKIDYRKDATFAWAAQELGIKVDELDADYSFTKEDSESASVKRVAALEDFLATQLNETETMMFEMLKDGLTKEQMMEVTHKTGGNIDTCKSRLRTKVRNFMKSIDYYGME